MIKQKQKNRKAIDIDNLVCLIIDMQDKFLKKHDPKIVELMVQNQVSVLDYCSNRDIPMVFLEYNGYGETIKDLKHIASGYDPLFLTKSYNSGFDGVLTDNEKDDIYKKTLKSILKETKRNHLLLMGINKNACVKATAEGALIEGFNFSTSKDLINSRKVKYSDWILKEDVLWDNDFYGPGSHLYVDYYDDLLDRII